MIISTKILTLETKIKKLQQQQKFLKQKENNKLINFLFDLNIDNIDDNILVGALLHIKQKIKNNDKIIHEWINAGEKALNKK